MKSMGTYVTTVTTNFGGKSFGMSDGDGKDVRFAFASLLPTKTKRLSLSFSFSGDSGDSLEFPGFLVVTQVVTNAHLVVTGGDSPFGLSLLLARLFFVLFGGENIRCNVVEAHALGLIWQSLQLGEVVTVADQPALFIIALATRSPSMPLQASVFQTSCEIMNTVRWRSLSHCL